MTIETTGYALYPNFLTTEEIDRFLLDYKNSRFMPASSVINQDMHDATDSVLETIHDKIRIVLKQLDFNVDLVLRGGTYTDTTLMNLDWHQDHLSYYMFQHHYRYLNFYITLSKENTQQSGLSIVPFDALEKTVPEYVGKIKNSGASRFYPKNNNTKVFNDNTGEEYTMPVNIDSIKISPELSPGDLLVIRGDVIHKTQDNITNRIALSVRCIDSTLPMNINKILAGCELKQQAFTANQSSVNEVKKRFESAGVTEMTVLEFFK